jgi:colicin import membrane protein
VAATDDEDHAGYHPVVWFATADLTDVVADNAAKAEALAAAQAAAAAKADAAQAGRLAQMQTDLEAANARHDVVMATALQASLDAAKKQIADRDAAKAAADKAAADKANADAAAAMAAAKAAKTPTPTAGTAAK